MVITTLILGLFFTRNSYIHNRKQGQVQESATGGTSKVYSDSGYVYFGNEAKGDLDADGMDDSAFIITKDEGGSGTFYYIGVAFKTSTGHLRTNPIFLGDRISPQTTEIRNGIIVVNYADREEGEPMTARPSVGVSKYFRTVNGILTSTETPGSL